MQSILSLVDHKTRAPCYLVCGSTTYSGPSKYTFFVHINPVRLSVITSVEALASQSADWSAHESVLSQSMLAKSEGLAKGRLSVALRLDRYQSQESHPIQLVFDRNIYLVLSEVFQ
jgi:hypothetical protein